MSVSDPTSASALWEAAEDGANTWAIAAHVVDQMGFLTLAFGTGQALLLWAYGGLNQGWEISPCLSVVMSFRQMKSI